MTSLSCELVRLVKSPGGGDPEFNDLTICELVRLVKSETTACLETAFKVTVEVQPVCVRSSGDRLEVHMSGPHMRFVALGTVLLHTSHLGSKLIFSLSDTMHTITKMPAIIIPAYLAKSDVIT